MGDEGPVLDYATPERPNVSGARRAARILVGVSLVFLVGVVVLVTAVASRLALLLGLAFVCAAVGAWVVVGRRRRG